MRRAFSILFLLILVNNMSSLSGQGSFTYTNRIFNNKIKSVQLFKEGWNLSYPVMKLGSSDRLVLHFDLLGNEPETYYYSFIHCNREWQKSDINTSDYLDGFSENQVKNMIRHSTPKSVIITTPLRFRMIESASSFQEITSLLYIRPPIRKNLF